MLAVVACTSLVILNILKLGWYCTLFILAQNEVTVLPSLLASTTVLPLFYE
ncbi:hypothetical protein RchiOBHm_Chr2g0148901 [Rosa chinensis]|uniref:Uncharacterized protein n=1 Tax=Rosa chinensis TaxID=74649 RepID=A0A2P6RZH8_ROSCH|nr:hypothetical protein RchiOBHm_Chr2g0148901 [Rosa chinensis]